MTKDSDLKLLVERLRAAHISSDPAFYDSIVNEAADAISRLVQERPDFQGIAKDKLDDLTSPERGWSICGYAIEKNGEYGLATVGGFVGWWTVAANNVEIAEARLEAAESKLSEMRSALEGLVPFAKWAIRESAFSGSDLEGAEVQEAALAHGLLIRTVYDPERHGPSDVAEPGMDWFEFSSTLEPSP